MQMNDLMNLTRHERACPYCHESITDRVDADTHVIGCSERWRRQHHVDATPAPATTPSIPRWTMPEPVVSRIESSATMARRILGESGPYSAGFRTLPAYEPAA